MGTNFPLFPQQASTLAGRVDALYFFLIAVTVFFCVLIFALLISFSLKFRARPGLVATQIEGSVPLELTWTIIPLIISMGMFVWGANLYFEMRRPPLGAMEIYGVPKQWMWKFEHPDGHREMNELHVPVGRPVRMTMISQDVIHSFFVPAFRVKIDVLPGRYSTTWFQATTTGHYHLFCSQYCGTKHSGMIGEVFVMEPAQYEQWLSGNTGQGSLASSGEKLFQSMACNTCHRSDSGARGPNLAGLFGKPVKLSDGRTVIADEAYIRESILTPTAKIVAGFQPIMPTFQGQINEEGVLALIQYIKTMNATQNTAAPTNNQAPAGAGGMNAGPAANGQTTPTMQNPGTQKQ